MRLAYKVAEHDFVLNINEKEEVVGQLTQYEPFRIDETAAVKPVFVMDVVADSVFPKTEGYQEELFQDDEGTQISAGQVNGQPYFEFYYFRELAARMLVNERYDHAVVALQGKQLFGLNNAIMIMYTIATADKQTMLFHSSVVMYEGKAYMFLGKSGTGKSTHSRLWLKYIPGTELMNDDNPVVRGLCCYGSPWSGKTPCYKNISAPLGAIVRLRQAPYNQISVLKGMRAYAAIVPSISGMRWNKRMADGLFEAENLLASQGRVFHLDCLPDEEAARICWEAVK